MRASTTDRHGQQYFPAVGTAECSIEGQDRIGFEKINEIKRDDHSGGTRGAVK